jgi:hypothetical protein
MKVRVVMEMDVPDKEILKSLLIALVEFARCDEESSVSVEAIAPNMSTKEAEDLLKELSLETTTMKKH